jgi:hypothetical protein
VQTAVDGGSELLIFVWPKAIDRDFIAGDFSSRKTPYGVAKA